jgi:hypothetical protein
VVCVCGGRVCVCVCVRGGRFYSLLDASVCVCVRSTGRPTDACVCVCVCVRVQRGSSGAQA